MSQTVTYHYRKLRQSKVEIKHIQARDKALYNAIVTLPQRLVTYSRYGITLKLDFMKGARNDRKWLEKWLNMRKARVKNNIRRYGKGKQLTNLQVLILQALNDNLSFTTYDEIVERMRDAHTVFDDYAIEVEEGWDYPDSPFICDSLDSDAEISKEEREGPEIQNAARKQVQKWAAVRKLKRTDEFRHS